MSPGTSEFPKVILLGPLANWISNPQGSKVRPVLNVKMLSTTPTPGVTQSVFFLQLGTSY